MPATAFAAIAAHYMIERSKHPIPPFSIVMQPFDVHLLLRRELIMRGDPDILIDLLKTVFTQAVKSGF